MLPCFVQANSALLVFVFCHLGVCSSKFCRQGSVHVLAKHVNPLDLWRQITELQTLNINNHRGEMCFCFIVLKLFVFAIVCISAFCRQRSVHLPAKNVLDFRPPGDKILNYKHPIAKTTA